MEMDWFDSPCRICKSPKIAVILASKALCLECADEIYQIKTGDTLQQKMDKVLREMLEESASSLIEIEPMPPHVEKYYRRLLGIDPD